MALPSSGPLALSVDIRAEELIKTPSLPADDVSLRTISDSAGFDQPDQFSEFYGYSSAILPTMASIRVSGGPNDNYMAFAATPATNGFVAITSRGFYFGTDSRGPQYNTRYQVDTSNSLGEFSKGFGGLSASRTYYCWGYVQNQIGEGYTSRGAATTLPAVAISDYSASYSGTIGYTLYGEDWAGSAGERYGWGNRGVGQYYMHPYYGWVSLGEGNYGFQTKYAHSVNKYYGTSFKRANNAPTQMRKRVFSYFWSETQSWYTLPNDATRDGYYTGNSGSSTTATSGQGSYVQNLHGWSGMAYYSGGTWYNPPYILFPNAGATATFQYGWGQSHESWEWNGYAYTN